VCDTIKKYNTESESVQHQDNDKMDDSLDSTVGHLAVVCFKVAALNH
jgi:hypothetical protein